MASDYVFYNGCTLAKNNAWNRTYLEGNRKALITELFFIFFFYFITQCLHAFIYKNSQDNPNSVRQSMMAVRISQVRASQGTIEYYLRRLTRRYQTRTPMAWTTMEQNICLYIFFPLCCPRYGPTFQSFDRSHCSSLHAFSVLHDIFLPVAQTHNKRSQSNENPDGYHEHYSAHNRNSGDKL